MDFRSIIEQFIPIAAALGAFWITNSVIPVIIQVSHIKHLFDDSTDSRKLHIGTIPNLGGVAIFAAIFIVFAVSGYATELWSPYLAAALTILFFSGIKDDILVISAWKKLFLQCLAAGILITGGNLVITDLGGIFGYHQVPLWSGMTLTFFTMVVVINAYNLIDGIDGLAGGIGVVASLFFGGWFWYIGLMAHAVLAFTLVGSLLAFLRYNFAPASIFMGDTGSQIVGCLLAFLAVSFVSNGVVSATAVPFQLHIPVLALAVLVVPLYDTLRVFLMRAAGGRSPFRPDRLHVHHQLLDIGLSHKASCIVIYAFNLFILGLAIILSTTSLNINALFAIVLLTAMVLFPTARFKRRLLEKVGIDMPSVHRIRNLERKYGLAPHTARHKQNGHAAKSKEQEKIAV